MITTWPSRYISYKVNWRLFESVQDRPMIKSIIDRSFYGQILTSGSNKYLIGILVDLYFIEVVSGEI